MFVYILLGWLMFRGGLVTEEGGRALANILLYLILPCVIIRAFYLEKNRETVEMVLMSFAGAAVVLGIAMAVASVLFHRRPTDNFSAAFSNAGFMGIPLITATLGQEAVIYVAAMIALLNVLQWTYGQMILSGEKSRIQGKAVVKSPVVLALIAGVLIFVSGFRFPPVVMDCMGAIAGMNAPVAMILLGIYMGKVPFSEMFDSGWVWWCSAVRLVIIPLITMAALQFIFPERTTMTAALLLSAAAPVGSNVAVYAQKLELDYRYAVKTVCLSTLLSIVTLPLIMLFNEILIAG